MKILPVMLPFLWHIENMKRYWDSSNLNAGPILSVNNKWNCILNVYKKNWIQSKKKMKFLKKKIVKQINQMKNYRKKYLIYKNKSIKFNKNWIKKMKN